MWDTFTIRRANVIDRFPVKQKKLMVQNGSDCAHQFYRLRETARYPQWITKNVEVKEIQWN